MGPDVVLAADETLIELEQAAQLSRVEPLPELVARGAVSGVTAISLDGDGALRRILPTLTVLRAASGKNRRAGWGGAARRSNPMVRPAPFLPDRLILSGAGAGSVPAGRIL
jgi:hypothetical protein